MSYLRLENARAESDGSGFVIRDGPWYGRILLEPDPPDDPSNYEICDRSGFKAKPGELRATWDGHMVLDEFHEERHPQDRLPPPAESGKSGAKNPESTDHVFLADGDVTVDDL